MSVGITLAATIQWNPFKVSSAEINFWITNTTILQVWLSCTRNMPTINPDNTNSFWSSPLVRLKGIHACKRDLGFQICNKLLCTYRSRRKMAPITPRGITCANHKFIDNPFAEGAFYCVNLYCTCCQYNPTCTIAFLEVAIWFLSNLVKSFIMEENGINWRVLCWLVLHEHTTRKGNTCTSNA